jgi:hypothetical protein
MKTVKAMLRFLEYKELPQNNAGGSMWTKDALIIELKRMAVKSSLFSVYRVFKKERQEYHILMFTVAPVSAREGWVRSRHLSRVETISTLPKLST